MSDKTGGHDWLSAEICLEEQERRYMRLGSVGGPVLNLVLIPLRDRFNAGERTQELYDEIMEVE